MTFLRTLLRPASVQLRVLSPFAALALVAACGGESEDSGGSGDGDSPGDQTEVGVEHELNELEPPSGASSSLVLSEGFCAAPTVSIDEYVPLTKATFRERLLEIPVGFLQPLHNAFLSVNEVDSFDSIFEVVWASSDTYCDWNADEDVDVWLPDDGQLLEAGTEQDIREELGRLIDDAVVLEEGETTLRLSFHECTTCREPIGATPQIITVRMSEDGWFEFDVELEEDSEWVKSAVVSPDGLFLQAPLAPAAAWFKDFNEYWRESEYELPNASGSLFLNAWKDEAGQLVSRLGLEQLNFDSGPAGEDNVNISAPGECLGVTQTVDPATGVAQNEFFFGNVTTTVPGSLNCYTDDCDTKESEGLWRYAVGGLTGSATLPGNGEADDFRASIEFAGLNRMTLNDDLIAEGGLGEEGRGGFMSVSVDKQDDGFVVSFEPTLRMAGAIAISNFSDRFRLSLPDWLSDEVFDLTFGGDPVASVFVPAREECQYDQFGDRIPTSEPARREVTVVSGTMTAVRATDSLTASEGQCVGKSLEPETNYTQTSDWVEMGFVCE